MWLPTGTFHSAFVVIILIAVLVRISEATNRGLTGPNVCATPVLRSEYKLVNSSYLCWSTRDMPCPSDDFLERHRWRRDPRSQWKHIRPRERQHWEDYDSREMEEETENNRCTEASLGMCYDLERRCETSWVEETNCCDGFVEENGRCVSSADCGWNNGGCQHSCKVDSRGEHRCVCPQGYKLGIDGTHCEDINECELWRDACESGECFNTEGGFYCTCANGYTLSSPRVCTEIDECKKGNGGCEQVCTNTPGAFYCSCREGFELIEGFVCEDKDECTINNGNCSHGCRNSWGSYACTCAPGIPLATDGHNCMEPGGEFDEDYQRSEVEEVVCSNPALIWGLVILGLLLLIGIIIFAVCCVRKRRRRLAAEAPDVAISTVSPPAYEEPAPFEGKLGFSNLALNQYADLPPSYDNAVYQIIDVIPPKVPPKPRKGEQLTAGGANEL